MTIGIAGKSGAGKNVAAALLAERGFFPVDCDAVGHRALSHCRREVETAFRVNLPIVNGQLDRSQLAAAVFADPDRLRRLEAMLLPFITDYCKTVQQTHEKTVLNGATLLESGLASLCDVVFWIESPRWLRFRRAMKRDRRSKAEIAARFSNQKQLSAQPWKKKADIYIIRNIGFYFLFRYRVFRTLKKVLNRSKPYEHKNN